MGYLAAPGRNGQICGVIIGESSSKPIAAKKKARKIKAMYIPDEVIIVSAQVESMSPELIKKLVLSRRHHRFDDVRGKAHREHEKYKLGRYV